MKKIRLENEDEGKVNKLPTQLHSDVRFSVAVDWSGITIRNAKLTLTLLGSYSI